MEGARAAALSPRTPLSRVVRKRGTHVTWVINPRRQGAQRPCGFAVPATRYVPDLQVGVSPVDGSAREIAFVNSVFARLNSADGGSNVT